MINVSSAWKSKFNQTLLPEMFVEINYHVTEPGLQESAIPSAENPEDFSDVAQVLSLVDKNPEPYSNLDYGAWGLDGTFSYFDGSPRDPGYVYAGFVGNTGSASAILTIDFSERHDVSIPGITITWDETFTAWAVDFRVRTYNAGGMVAEKTVTGNNSIVSTVWLEMVGYSRITIEVLKWSHIHQRVRISEVALGIESNYTKKDLLGYEHSQSVDLLTASLPEGFIRFKLRNDDNRWNPDNPTGFEKYLVEQQEIRVRYGMDVDGTTEWIDGGTYWLSEWDTPMNGLEADFTARDLIEFLNIAYKGRRSGTLYEIAMDAFSHVSLPTMDDGSERYILSETLKDITTDFSEDGSDYTVSEILQMVAHAGCCVFYQDRKGVLRIEPRPLNYSGYMITPDVSYAHPEYSISKPLKKISVECEPDGPIVDIEVSHSGEVQTVNNPMIIETNHAASVGENAKEILKNRRVISGDFRTDLRLDTLDNVIVTSKYASNVISITDIKYSTTGGAFKGTYTGRVVSIDLESSKVYSGEFYPGEVW